MLREDFPSRVFKCQIWVSLLALTWGGGQQQREIQLLSDANSTVGKFLQASTQAKMHVQVRRFSGQKIHLFLS